LLVCPEPVNVQAIPDFFINLSQFGVSQTKVSQMTSNLLAHSKNISNSSLKEYHHAPVALWTNKVMQIVALGLLCMLVTVTFFNFFWQMVSLVTAGHKLSSKAEKISMVKLYIGS